MHDLTQKQALIFVLVNEFISTIAIDISTKLFGVSIASFLGGAAAGAALMLGIIFVWLRMKYPGQISELKNRIVTGLAKKPWCIHSTGERRVKKEIFSSESVL